MAEFDRIQDAQQKIQGSIIRYKGYPVQANQLDGWKWAGIELGTSKIYAEFDPRDDDVDVASPRLGYTNTNNGGDGAVKHIVRVPVRRSVQGLTTQNTYYAVYLVDRGVSLNNIHQNVLFSQAVKRTILGEYPSYEEALQYLKKSNTPKQIAVDRKVMIERDELGIIKFNYFGAPVAFKSMGETVFIPTRFIPYSDLLQEALPSINIEIIE